MRLPLLAALAAVSLTLPVQAGPVADAAAAVEAAVAAGDFAAWQAANGTLLTEAWFAPGLHFNRLILTAAPASGYGSYEARPNSTYGRGEDIFVYAEPEGYGFGDLGGGKLEIAFDIDLRVLDPAGTVLVEAPDFMAVSHQVWGPAREFVANMTVSMGEAPAGAYTLEFTFRDRHGGQKSTFTTDVTIQ
ncbi:hypothetical protein LHP98_05415 [Rhodobacter sp. Har01]|uniref:hypothetical protein n=1 Tax=Rhodobacter sp. Har01 TaxID=2883999 RepID=UPI001D085A00|nr:hypothetical protein [Rhodobacter sp. Har01]MCB6177568.1 hypothetical protein [Rhodobacter sp. Har01]